MKRKLELLSPAKTAEIGREAILHGADAVYIGGPAFGARANASNSVKDIADLCDFAHRYHARVFATLNTILHDAELEPARRLIHSLHDAGVDALIVQDMGLLELDIPPLELHASTQTDIRSVEKADFLARSGFSQIVLARELTLAEIGRVRESVDAVLEFFVHGALCVAYSGQCYISHAQTGRSANRGDCSQACRLPYTLQDDRGGVVAFEKHLLSMKDNDQSANLEALIDAGISSFKIEGRYKDAPYVKNVTAHYRMLLDAIMEKRPELGRSSSGRSAFGFAPDPEKTFNRGATDYFVNGRQMDIGAFDSPKFVGKPIGVVVAMGWDWFDAQCTEALHNGDGIAFMKKREAIGTRINKAEKMGELWRIHPNEMEGLKVGLEIYRNRDHAWEQALEKASAERRIAVDVSLGEIEGGIELRIADKEGFCGRAAALMDFEPVKNLDTMNVLKENLARLGNTIFQAESIDLFRNPRFVPASVVNALRRDAVEMLERERALGRPVGVRKAAEEPPVPYPEETLSYLANVYNASARAFYEKHGVKLIEAAYEAHEEDGEVSLMITRHCLRYAFNLCPKQAKGVEGVQGQVRADPMTLVSGGERLTLRFDCRACEMHVVGRIKKSILNSPPPAL